MPSVNRYLRRSSLSRPIPCLFLFSSLCGIYMTMLIAASLSSTLSLAQRHFYIRRVRAENKNEKLIERTIVCSYAGTKHQTRTHEHKQFEGICLFRFREHLEVIVNTVLQFHKLIARRERVRGFEENCPICSTELHAKSTLQPWYTVYTVPYCCQ